MNRLFFIFIIFFAGCAHHPQNDISDADQEKFFKPVTKIPIREVRINQFITTDDHFENIPDKIIDISFTQPVLLSDLFLSLAQQGVNIFVKIDQDKTVLLPSFQGSFRSFLQSLQASYGLMYDFKKDVLIIRDHGPVYVKVLMPGLSEKLIALINSFGGQNAFYDELSARIVFDADFYVYSKIRSYFENNGYLTLVIFDVMILESETDRNFDTGFDFERLAAMLSESTSAKSNIELTGSSNGFALSVKGDNVSFDSILHNLKKIQNFSIMQSARVSTLNGFSSKIDVSEKIPYVSQVELTTLNNSDDLIQSYSFDRASSGLIVSLKPSIIDDFISLDFNCTISNVTSFLEVGTKEQLISQPIYTERNLVNQLIFQPGMTVLIGGLRYQKNNNLRSELIIKPTAGYSSETDKTFTVSVLIRAELVKYLFI